MRDFVSNWRQPRDGWFSPTNDLNKIYITDKKKLDVGKEKRGNDDLKRWS